MHVCTIYDDFSMLCRKVNILSKRKKKQWHVLPFHDCHLHCNYCQKEFAAIMKLHSLRVSNDYFYLYCPPLDAFIHGNAAPPTNMTINHHQIYPASDNVASPGDYIALKTPSHGFVVGGSWGITFFKLFQHSNMCLRLRTRTRIQRFACVGGGWKSNYSRFFIMVVITHIADINHTLTLWWTVGMFGVLFFVNQKFLPCWFWRTCFWWIDELKYAR